MVLAGMTVKEPNDGGPLLVILGVGFDNDLVVHELSMLHLRRELPMFLLSITGIFFFFFISKYQFIKSARGATHVHRKYTKRAHKYKLLIRKRHTKI